MNDGSTPDDEKPWLSLADACRELGIGRTQLYTKHLYPAGPLRRQHDGHRIVVSAHEVERLKHGLNFPSGDDPLVRELVARAVVLADLSPLPTHKALRSLFASLADAARDLRVDAR
jgi:hypothetical protein